MSTGLTDHRIRSALKARAATELWDEKTPGLSLRVFATGKATWTLRYRSPHGGRFQRLKLGTYPTLLVSDARKLATSNRAAVFGGADPAAERRARRQAPTLAAVCEKYLQEQAAPMRKPGTAALYKRYLRSYVLPTLGTRIANTITPADVTRLHRELSDIPTTANRVIACISTVYSWASDKAVAIVPEGFNPARGLEKFREQGRECYLSTNQLARFGEALRAAETKGLSWPERTRSKHDRKPANRRTIFPPHVAAAFRLLLFTGCRVGEILNLRWSEVDLERGLLLLPDSKTGKKTVVLNAPAALLLSELPRVGDYVVLGEGPSKPRADLNKPWRLLRQHAGLKDVRLHDLRHTHASIGAGAGLGLPIIGKLLGHRHAATTSRYAHIDADPLRVASDRIGGAIADAMGDPRPPSAAAEPIRGRGHG